MLGAVRARAAAASQQLASARRPRESTTNAHDWVWLGRATLERAACAPQQVFKLLTQAVVLVLVDRLLDENACLYIYIYTYLHSLTLTTGY